MVNGLSLRDTIYKYIESSIERSLLQYEYMLSLKRVDLKNFVLIFRIYGYEYY